MKSQEKIQALTRLLREMESVVVAFSGGVDSTFLLYAARQALGERAIAVTALSESFPKSEREEARRLATLIGAPHVEIETHELEREGYKANAPNRCFFCKTELFEKLIPFAEQKGAKVVVYGEIADDHLDHRPGAEAARRMRVRAPLAEVGLTKLEIRALSKECSLPTWNKPSQACLSSRIPYGQEVTARKLAQIERAEEVLRGLGLRQFRVRHHDTIARLEVDPEEFDAVMHPAVRDLIVQKLRECGFVYVALDLQGYRTGALNEVLRQNSGEVAANSPRP